MGWFPCCCKTAFCTCRKGSSFLGVHVGSGTPGVDGSYADGVALDWGYYSSTGSFFYYGPWYDILPECSRGYSSACGLAFAQYWDQDPGDGPEQTNLCDGIGSQNQEVLPCGYIPGEGYYAYSYSDGGGAYRNCSSGRVFTYWSGFYSIRELKCVYRASGFASHDLRGILERLLPESRWLATVMFGQNCVRTGIDENHVVDPDSPIYFDADHPDPGPDYTVGMDNQQIYFSQYPDLVNCNRHDPHYLHFAYSFSRHLVPNQDWGYSQPYVWVIAEEHYGGPYQPFPPGATDIPAFILLDHH